MPAGDTSCSAGMIFGAEHLEGIDPVPQPRAERSRGPASRPPARSPHLFGERLKKRDTDARWNGGAKVIVVVFLGSCVDEERVVVKVSTLWRGLFCAAVSFSPVTNAAVC